MPHPVDHNQNSIEVKNVSFRYGAEEVLSHINFNIHPGDYIGMVGPNGAGKSTLIKIILGLLPLQSGEVVLFGKQIKTFREFARIGYVPQRPMSADSFFPVTVREVVLMGRFGKRGLFAAMQREDIVAVERALLQVRMTEFADRLIHELSGGQLQRVFIARALVSDPEIIFLDEPMTGLDQQTQDELYAVLKRINTELGISIILVSHDVERLVEEVMHIVCVDKTLTFHASPEEFLKESTHKHMHGQDISIIHHHHA